MTKSNDEIYDKCVDIEKQIIKTNGKVNMNRWLSTTALSLGAFIGGMLLVGKTLI